MMRRTVDVVLMEFDGVLAQTALARRDALRAVLAEDGHSLSLEAYQESCAGLSTADAVRAALTRLEAPTDETGLELLALRVDRAFSVHVGKGVVLVDGVPEMIERLAARARLGIVTRASRRDVELVLSMAQLDHAFACVIGADDAYPAKPDPSPYRAALRRIERTRPVAPDGIVVALEDALPGIRAARAAGFRCIAVGELPAHVAMEADAIVPAVTGLDIFAVGRLVTHEGERFA
jgi:beta-phosphoglucomutase-like phosphatase (HAD superfamily)